MSEVICIANQKGGVAKTTTTANLGIGLVRSGKRVLLVDFDPQADLCDSLGLKHTDDLDYTIANAMEGLISEGTIDYERLIFQHREGVDIIPSNIDLSDLELRLVSVMGREKILNTCLEPLKRKYDYILIDCPPSLGMLTINALSTADKVLIPVQAQYLPAKGMTKLLSTVNKVKRQINPKIQVCGIAITLADMQTNMAKSTIEAIQKNFGKHLNIFHSIIPVCVKAAEAGTEGKSIYQYAGNSTASQAYTSLTKEVIKADRQKNKDKSER